MNSDKIITQWINKYIRQGDVVFDIGANQGLHTKTMLQAVGKLGRVVAFEPVPANIAILSSIRASNNALMLESCAVGEEIGRKSFNIDIRSGMGAAASSFHKLAGLDEVTQIEVSIKTLDSFVGEKGNSLIPRFIKIDVEGYEINVFQGATSLIDAARPIMVFEFWETWFPRVRPIFEFLSPGYTFFSSLRGEDAYSVYCKNAFDGVADILCLPVNSNELNHEALRCVSGVANTR